MSGEEPGGQEGDGSGDGKGAPVVALPHGLLAVLRGLHLEACPTWWEPTEGHAGGSLRHGLTAGVVPSLCQTHPGGGQLQCPLGT